MCTIPVPSGSCALSKTCSLVTHISSSPECPRDAWMIEVDSLAEIHQRAHLATTAGHNCPICCEAAWALYTQIKPSPPSPTCISLADFCPAVPGREEHDSREGRLCLVWVPEAAVHVQHSDTRNDQPHPVPG